MMKIHVLGHTEPEAPVPHPLPGRRLLYHQWKTMEGLRDHKIVVNCTETGSGKTEAALLALLLPELNHQNALVIAPTNELIRQHVVTAERFVQEHGLPHRVQAIRAAEVEDLRRHGAEQPERRGEALNRVLNEKGPPLLVVTNPDIFHYALYCVGYSAHDRRNLFETFVNRFYYLIVDEVHYYSSRQLACFLFYFALWSQWGYFSNARRACLLSATPESILDTYLERLFPTPEEVLWVRPGEAVEGLRQIPVLAPIDVELEPMEVDAWVSGAGRERLAQWLVEGRDAAVISSALWRINAAYASLRTDSRFRNALARLTGAETREAREEASGFPIVLATPTVDIGYNFDKPGKERQPLDAVVADARRSDEALQRLGRASRVLGRGQTDVPSQGILLLTQEACDAFRGMDGQTMDRRAFRRALRTALPSRPDFDAYMRSYAVLEVFRPICELQRQFAPADMHHVEDLTQSVYETFAPRGSVYSPRRAFMEWHKQDQRARVLHQDGKGIETFVPDYLRWLGEDGRGVPNPSAIEEHLTRQSEAARQLVLPWLQGEYALWEALFRFREGFSGPPMRVEDPHHLLSGADSATYDLFHIVANFEVEWSASHASSPNKYGLMKEPVAEARLIRQRLPHERLHLGFSYHEERMNSERWMSLFTRRPVALRGLHIVTKNASEGVVPVAPVAHRAITDLFIPLLLVQDRDIGAFQLEVQRQGLSSYSVEVSFPGEEHSRGFRAVAGTGAFTLHASLSGYFAGKVRREATQAFIV